MTRALTIAPSSFKVSKITNFWKHTIPGMERRLASRFTIHERIEYDAAKMSSAITDPRLHHDHVKLSEDRQMSHPDKALGVIHST